MTSISRNDDHLYKPSQLEETLRIILDDVLPVTLKGVKDGEGVFGGAIVRKSDLSIVCVGTNAWSKSPLKHGETECIEAFWRIPKGQRPEPKDCIFISTHESCPLCISAMCWSGFDSIYYFFTHQETAAHFDDPVDAHIMQEVWGRTPPNSYERRNSYFTAVHLEEALSKVQDQTQRTKLRQQSDDIWKGYKDLWEVHQEVAKTKVKQW